MSNWRYSNSFSLQQTFSHPMVSLIHFAHGKRYKLPGGSKGHGRPSLTVTVKCQTVKPNLDDAAINLTHDQSFRRFWMVAKLIYFVSSYSRVVLLWFLASVISMYCVRTPEWWTAVALVVRFTTKGSLPTENDAWRCLDIWDDRELRQANTLNLPECPVEFNTMKSIPIPSLVFPFFKPIGTPRWVCPFPPSKYHHHRLIADYFSLVIVVYRHLW